MNRGKNDRRGLKDRGFVLIILCALLFPFKLSAQHLRIFACAISNDSAGAFLGGSSRGSGLYQSDDTGKTWKHLGWNNIKCYSMDMVESSNGRILYMATGLGVLRSTDYGVHWKQITDWRVSEVMDVAVWQAEPMDIEIATAHGPWESNDRGKTWAQMPMEGLKDPFMQRIYIEGMRHQRPSIFVWDGASTKPYVLGMIDDEWEETKFPPLADLITDYKLARLKGIRFPSHARIQNVKSFLVKP